MNSPLRIRLDKAAKAGEILKARNCNLSCLWCHGDYFRHKTGGKALGNKELIEAVRKVITVSSRSMVEIKISGQGEPCLAGSKELCNLIKGLRSLPKVSTIKLVTNGTLLKGMSAALKNAGLDRVTISLHSLNRERYLKITGNDKLHQTLEGIEAALKVGFKVKLNVIFCQLNADETWNFVKLAEDRKITLKFFDLLPINPISKNLYLPLEELRRELEKKSILRQISKTPYIRYEYRFSNDGATIQVKDGRVNNCHQKGCQYRKKCLEGCRSSVRISQDGILHPCGVRTDNIISLLEPNISRQEIKEALLSGGKS